MTPSAPALHASAPLRAADILKALIPGQPSNAASERRGCHHATSRDAAHTCSFPHYSGGDWPKVSETDGCVRASRACTRPNAVGDRLATVIASTKSEPSIR